MLFETTILELISTKNLVKVTLSETQLESNFQAILKALRSHDSCIANLLSKVSTLESTVKNHELLLLQREKQSKQQEQTSISEQAIKKLLKDTLINNQQLKKLVSNVGVLKEKVNNIDGTTKEMESNMHKNQANVQQRLDKLEKFEGFIKKTEDRLDKIEGNMQKYDKYEDRIKRLEKDLQQQLDKMSKLDQALLKIDKLAKEDKGKEEKQGTNQKTSDEHLHKALAQLESRLIHMMNEHKSKTDKEFQRIYGMINDINMSQIVKITETLNDHAKTSKKMSEDIWKLNDQLYKHQSQQPQASSGEPFNIKRVTQLERKVQQLSRMLSNLGHDSNNLAKNYSTAFKTPQKIDELEWSPAPKRQKTHQRQESKDLNQIKQESLLQEKTNFKKEIIQKLKQQKGDFNKAIKKIENINLKKQEEKQKIEDLQEKLLRLQHIINGKIDEQGMKKWMRYIQNKINYLYRIINVQSPEEDACIARKNWICLSCDKKLDAYKGKVGNHMVSAQMKGKNIEQEVIGGGMLFRSKSKYEMPTIKK